MAIIVSCGIMISCATAPVYNPNLPLLVIDKAIKTDTQVYGRQFTTNPYLEPQTLLRGKLNEFYILKLQFNLPTNMLVSIITEITSKDGQEAAKAYDKNAFTDFWDINTMTYPDNDAKNQNRNTAIARSCIPAMSFTQRAGVNTLFLPIIGKNPIPRPAKIYIQVSVGSEVPYIYTATLE